MEHAAAPHLARRGVEHHLQESAGHALRLAVTTITQCRCLANTVAVTATAGAATAQSYCPSLPFSWSVNEHVFVMPE